jgi:hypothetical protein
MNLEELDLEKLVGGFAVGSATAVVHVLLAGIIISPLMYGSLFYYQGPLAIIGDLVLMFIVGGLLGAIGAFVALQMKTSPEAK